jgi:hypothetical protein
VIADALAALHLEGVQAVGRAEVEGLAAELLATVLRRSTLMPHTGSVAPRRTGSQNIAAKTARPMMLVNSGGASV